MSAIQALFRVMSLRDADSLHLESNKVPELRRKGRVEPMALPALEPELVDGFVQSVTSEVDRATLSESSVAVTFVDPDGGTYTVSIHRAGAGYQLVARRASSARPTKASPPSPAGAEVWARPAPSPSQHAPPPVGTARGPLGDVAPLARGPAIGAGLRAAVASARRRGASDVLVSTGHPVWARVDGVLEVIGDAHVGEAELRTLVSDALASEAARAGAAAEQGGADFAFELDGARVRGHGFSHLGGVAVSLRLLGAAPPAISELGLPPQVAGAVGYREGLVLVCGPTGSGKSTTLASLVQLLDSQRAAHIVTLEDPVEARLVGHRGLIHQRELGVDFPSFAEGLRAALRETPDVILLGELRDPESISAALTAAETGHLVLASMHAPNAAGAVDRILDSFAEGRQRQVRTQLAGALRMIVTQLLLPRVGGGRVAAAEVVPVTSAVANIIRKGELQTLATAIQSGREHGLVPLERALAQLVQRGLVSEAEARRVAADSQLLRAQLA